MKKLLTIAMITLAAFAAKADLYLYWTMDLAEESGFSYSYGQLMSGETVITNFGGYEKAADGDSFASILELTSASFYIALFNENDVQVAISNTLTYGDALSQYAIGNGIHSDMTTASTPWNGGAFTATIPEPTSGLMLLLGLGALALKRKVA